MPVVHVPRLARREPSIACWSSPASDQQLLLSSPDVHNRLLETGPEVARANARTWEGLVFDETVEGFGDVESPDPDVIAHAKPESFSGVDVGCSSMLQRPKAHEKASRAQAVERRHQFLCC